MCKRRGPLRGTIAFNGKAPARIRIDMSMDPACAMSKEENDAEQYDGDGWQAGQCLRVCEGRRDAFDWLRAIRRAVVLDQKGCRYTPHVIALQQGGTVEFRNSDPTMHNIHTTPNVDGDPAVDVSQSPLGKPEIRAFRTGKHAAGALQQSSVDECVYQRVARRRILPSQRQTARLRFTVCRRAPTRWPRSTRSLANRICKLRFHQIPRRKPTSVSRRASSSGRSATPL